MTEQSERVRNILQRQDELEQIRQPYEAVWDQVAELCCPDAPRMDWRGKPNRDADNAATRQQQYGSVVFDNTIASAEDRLTAGLESLITPQSEKWHGLTTEEYNDEETQEEKEWAEGLRDYLFSLRYSASSNFVPAIQGIYSNVVRFGPAYLYAEEGFGSTYLRYSSIPVNEGYIARNRWGDVDVFHRRYARSIREIAQLVGYDKLPASLKDRANDPVKCLEKLTIIQGVQPREERRMYDLAGERIYLDSPYVSYHVLEGEENAMLMEKPFQSFPVSTFDWKRYEGETYSMGPMVRALVTVREVNAVRRTGLRALQQITDPALAHSPDLDFVPTLNPGESYPGLMNEQGNMLIAPISTGQNPSYAFEYANARAEEIKDMMYVNLFQVLINNPQMTATEALIRQEEKGALLGPAGAVIQRGLSTNLDRELTILEAKGIYEEGSRFVPPDSLAGKDVRPTFTSPLDILRKSAEARDAMQVLTTASQMAQMDPTVMDNIDSDEALRIIQSAGRAPQRIFRRNEEVEQIRKSRQEAQQAQQGIATIAQGAETAKTGAEAANVAQQAGLLGLLPQGNA